MALRAVALVALLATGAPAAAGGADVSDHTPEFERETAALVEATEALFDALEAASATAAATRHRLDLAPRPIALDLPPAGRAALSSAHGAVDDLTGYRITWYPTHSLLGTVDFTGTWGNGGNLVCGYATWDLSDPARPDLVTVTTAYLDTGGLGALPADGAHAALLRANCAYGEIAANFDLVRGRDAALN